MTGLRRRLSGLLAFLLILAILVGLPAVLLAVGANPFSGSGVPTWEAIKTALTAPDDGRLFLALLKIIGWAAWAFMTVSLLLEIVARARNVRAPRLPGLTLPQHAASGLVGAAVLLFVALPVNAPAAHAAPAAPVTQAQSSETPTAVPTASSATLTDRENQSATTHTVKEGETLWSIAEDKLGDGHRYHQIAAANPQLLEGDADTIEVGWVLDIPAAEGNGAQEVVVERGDTLSGIAAEELGDASRYPEVFTASRDIIQPGGARLEDPDEIGVGWTLAVPAQTGSSVGEESRHGGQEQSLEPAPVETAQPRAGELNAGVEAGPSQQQHFPLVEQVAPVAEDPAALETPASDDHLGEESQWVPRTSAGVGALLAAGVLALLAGRRRAQQRRRRPGQRLHMPPGPTEDLEQDLRATADVLSVETVDVALRSLARHCAATKTPLPSVRAARLTATEFDLYLAEPAQLPTPWSATADSTVWTLRLKDTGALIAVDATDAPAPYPALVTIGHDEEDGHVLLNLESLGGLGVAGRQERAREILAALAIELATSVWADDLQVTIVGAFPELEDALQTGRIRYLPSVGRMLDELERRVDADRRTLADQGVPDLHTARVIGAAPDAWSPEIVLVAGDITDRQRTQLEQMVSGLPRVALAAVINASGVGEWSLQLSTNGDPDLATLAPIGLQLRPQRIPAEQYGHLLHMISLADPEEMTGVPEPEPTLADIEAVTPTDEAQTAPELPEVTLEQLEASCALAPAADTQPATAGATPHLPGHVGRHDEAPIDKSAAADEDPAPSTPPKEASVKPMPLPAPRVLVLGPVELLNAGGKVEPTKRARLLEYAAYLALHPGATHTAIDDAIWPDRKTEDNLTTRNPATTKLRRWVGTSPEGADYLPRHQAGEGYAFAPEVTTDAAQWDDLIGGEPISAPTEKLEAALQLVRGIPFEGTHRKRYAWAEPLKQRLISEIVDASYELGRRRLMEGRWRSAEQAVVIGLRVEPAQELLWRLRILAAHESRNPAAEAEAIERLLTITDQLECQLEPETEQLLTALKRPGTDFDQLVANAI